MAGPDRVNGQNKCTGANPLSVNLCLPSFKPMLSILSRCPRLLASLLLTCLMTTSLTACAKEDRMVFHSFSYHPAVDSPGVEWLDCLYGDALGTHTQHEVDIGRARRGECFNGGGEGPVGDFVYVKWRDKATQKVYEDRVDLKSRLPAVKDMRGTKIYVLIDDNQLYVYLIPDYDWNTKRNHRPADKLPNGPSGYEYLDVRTLYPDNAPPKVRGGGQ
jgi:hypothetical protein